jgi:aminomethyltransferase
VLCPLCCAVVGLQGKDAIKFLEGLVTGDIAGLADGTGSLSVFTNKKGGIIDDTVITKVSLEYVIRLCNRDDTQYVSTR